MIDKTRAEELAIKAIKDRMPHCFMDGVLVQKPQVVKDFISHFTEGYNSRQSEIDELTKQLKQEIECVEFIKQTCDNYENQNAELTKQVEMLRNMLKEVATSGLNNNEEHF